MLIYLIFGAGVTAFPLPSAATAIAHSMMKSTDRRIFVVENRAL